MEKRPKKTLARTLVCGVFCTKLAVIVILFVPFFLSVSKLSKKADARPAPAVTKTQQVSEKPVSRELVKVYSIVKAHRPDVSDDEAWEVAQVILEESAKHKLDALLISALIQVESGFQYAAVSPSGARGLMQIMPDTGRALTRALRREIGLRPAAFRPEWLDDPFVNIRLGVYYLHDLKNQFHDWRLALSAYNFGPAEIQSRLENNVAFSSDFAGIVLAAYRGYLNKKQPSF